MEKADRKRLDELLEFVQNDMSFNEAMKVYEFIDFMMNKLTCAKMFKVSELIGMMGGKDNE